jgi:hypothetical protein
LTFTFAGFSAARAAEGEAQQAGVSSSIQLMAGGLVGAFTIFSILVMACLLPAHGAEVP